MNRFISLLLTVFMAVPVIACPAASAEDLSTGTPWIDSEVEGAITEDMTFDLKDDYAAAVNGEWVLHAEYAQGYPIAGTAADVNQLVQDQLVQLITGDNAENDPYLAQVQSLYELYMDWDARNAAGITPLLPVLEKLEAIASIEDLNAFLCLGSAERGFLTGPFNFFTKVDYNDSSRYTIAVTSSGLILQDSAEYSELTERGALVKENQLDLGRKMLIKAGYTEARADEIISNAMAFETAIAAVIPTSDEKSSPDYSRKINNLITREELEERQGNIPIIACILASGVKDEDFTDVMLYYPEWLETLNAMYTDENAAGMRDDMILRYVINNCACLDEECLEWNCIANNAVNGVKETMPINLIAVNYVRNLLKWQLARAYASRYFTQEDKDRIAQLCADIIAEYKNMLREEDFLSAETISYACEKLDAMQVFSLYPDDDQWPDTSGLSFRSKAEGGTFWEAVNAIDAFDDQHDFAEMSEPTDRTRWPESVLPTTVNASYGRNVNAIVILAAFCQGGMYNSEMTTEEMYGAIGSIIGHEISHAFDPNGAQFDKNGNLANWWNDEDYQCFQAKVQKMMDYYNTISPWEGQYVHGEIITGEATADMAGMKVCLRIARSIPDFDYDLFFRTYANSHKLKDTREYELTLLTNQHPLSYLRINVTLAQQDEFIETYGISEGDGMYIAPEDRVAIW